MFQRGLTARDSDSESVSTVQADFLLGVGGYRFTKDLSANILLGLATFILYEEHAGYSCGGAVRADY